MALCLCNERPTSDKRLIGDRDNAIRIRLSLFTARPMCNFIVGQRYITQIGGYNAIFLVEAPLIGVMYQALITSVNGRASVDHHIHSLISLLLYFLIKYAVVVHNTILCFMLFSTLFFKGYSPKSHNSQLLVIHHPLTIVLLSINIEL